MNDRFYKFVTTISRLFDRFAAVGLVLLMALVAGNVALRVILGSSILGTYDFVGFLTSIIIGLSLAYCAVQDGHIAISIVMQRFSAKVQKVVDFIVGSVAFVLLVLVSWHIGKHAHTMYLRGEVSLTTMTPHYPFIYVIAAGIGVLCLVVLSKLLNLLLKGSEN